MQNLYRVKSRYYLPQAKANFEYTWFVYQRQHSPIYNKYVNNRLLQLGTEELFTLAEAYQLQTVLKAIYAGQEDGIEVAITIEEVDSATQTNTSLRDTYQKSGHFVDPEVIASMPDNTLNFQVAAAITYEMQYQADDFLTNLSAEKLEKLRQMHRENNG